MAPAGQESVGDFWLRRLIRSGALCEIWEAEPYLGGDSVALKLLRRGGRASKADEQALQHEYKVGRNLDHPNVIKTIDIGSDKVGAFLVLEFFDAPNLKQWLQAGVTKLHPHLKEILLAAAHGLHHLHGQGWIHRDVKPDNFLLGENTKLKLIDFNLAQRPKGALGRLLSGKTKVQGTQSYMSPEQIRGQPVDIRSDIYSFGCMAYELVAGRPPHTGVSTQELLNKHLKTKPQPLETICDNLSIGFGKLMQTMLAKSPDDRPTSFDVLLEQLDEIKVFRNKPRVEE